MNQDRWQGPFSNLMMLLFALFVVLYASARVELGKMKQLAESLQAQIDSPQKPLLTPPVDIESGSTPIVGTEELLQVKMSDAVGMLFKNEYPDSSKTQDWVEFESLANGSFLVRIAPDELFDVGQVRVKESMMPLLNALGGLIKKSSRRIRIEGHADYEDSEALSRQTQGSLKNTWELSSLRAAWVAQYWMRKFDFDPAKMEVSSWGKYKPLPALKGLKQKNNKRLEIVIEKI
jgi:chemotaxis protein MotB